MRITVHSSPADRDGREIELRPTKIVGIGVNYREHAKEMGRELPEEPLMFLKPPSALCGPGTPIQRPRGYDRVDHEAELGVVIGQRVRSVEAGEALQHVLGYTCVNDVSVRALQKQDGQWTRAKGMDSFCPVGPRIMAGIDPSDLAIRARVNGELRQDSRTSDMIFSAAELVAFVSRYMTLEPHDIITTGTPQGVGNLAEGDTVEIEIENLGVLSNPVIGVDL
jgi:2-keto-4-pentenoate hydratase/2-oxohepta-3-ene-1,7-dioic acid hydratase in catechol pathway